MTSNQNYFNEILPFSIEGTQIRGRIVRLSNVYRDLLDTKQYPEIIANFIGELSALTILLADTIKYDGIFILQTQSDGPINMSVADITHTGLIRGYALYDKGKLDKIGNHPSIPELLGSGHLAFTVDQGSNKDRYQGIVALEGNTLTECAQNYFRQSEQIETAIIITADPDRKKAAAILIQRMPKLNISSNLDNYLDGEDDSESWRNAVILMSSIKKSELLDHEINSEELLYRLYHNEGVRIFNRKSIKYECRCSSEKLGAVLASLSEKELESMMNDSGLVIAKCEFCNHDHMFNKKTLKKYVI
ncbi:MAG: Hsp33 family molecular chaperone HslO [Rhodospirillales bacterium]